MKLSVRPGKTKLIAAAVLSALTCLGTALVPGAPIRFAVLMCVFFFCGACLQLSVRDWYAVLTMLLFTAAASLGTVLLCQAINELRGSPRSWWLICLGCLCFFLAVLLVHLILLCVSRVSMKPAVAIITAVILTLAVANLFTFKYRGTGLTPFDLLGARTAFNILDNYSFSIDKNIWYAIVFFAAEIFFAACIRVERFPRISVRRITALTAALVLGVFVHFSLNSIAPGYWANNGTLANGFVVNFMRQIRDCFFTKPKGYSVAEIRSLEQRFEENADSEDALPEKLPHIVVIMNESLSDFRVYGEMETSEPVTPFLDSLQENTIRGFALTSAYGGKTPNAEYEFLTGNSMAFYGPSVTVFPMLKNPSYTLERYLDTLGYVSYATHPEVAGNWDRNTAYPLLGFTHCAFRESYPEAETVMGWVKDKEVYENIIREFETGNQDAPRFLYAVTSQNHGPYGEEDEGLPAVSISGYDSDSAAAYLGRIHESDRAFQKLIEYFSAAEEPVIVLLYGDHHPFEETEMVEYLHGGELQGLDEEQLLYEIPYFIWANFDIEEQQPGLTSINYLSNYLLETAGLPLAPYNRFLKQVQEKIPALNVFGYYSLDEGRFLKIEEAEGAEKEALLEYEMLQYNATHDAKNRSEVFFPLD